jgi:uncharacterized SAM-binding protein YcdF (DUF218 family)
MPLWYIAKQPMFFILSKLLLVLISSLTWVFILLIMAVTTKAKVRKQRYLITGVVVFWLFGNQFTANLLASTWDIEPYRSQVTSYSAVIVLGGFVSEDADGKGHFNNAVDRFTQATRLVSDGRAKHLLFSGGTADFNPDKFSEAQFVKGELKKLGFADSLVLLDGKARNTFENAAYSKVLLQKANLKPPYLLVTSAYHMRRAMLIFKKAGLNVIPYPCDYIVPHGTVMPTYFVPGTEAFGMFNLYLKEMVGYIVAALK